VGKVLTTDKSQHKDIFQIARNINVGFFASVVLHDYVAAILNTPRANSEWSLDFGKEINKSGKRVDRGVGNVVSVEFAFLYHWHAALSAADDEWMAVVIKETFPDLKDVEDLTLDMFKQVVMKQGHSLAPEAKDWTFGKLSVGLTADLTTRILPILSRTPLSSRHTNLVPAAHLPV
jgi:hypothetical protein